MPFPPKNEQIKIFQHLDDRRSKLEQVVFETENSIALLKEHRTALISAAVTGKIDVRNHKEVSA